MTVKRSMLNSRVGDLVVKREIEPDVFFCACEPEKGKCVIEGGGSRELTRKQLHSGQILSCSACAKRNRSLAGGRPRVEPPLPPEPIAKHAPTVCNGLCKWHNTELGPMLGADPDCDKH